MKLEKWALIAEIVGAVAVTLSLLIVAFEIRGNTQASQAATLQDSVGYDVSLLTALGSDPDVATTWDNYVYSGTVTLTEKQITQVRYLFAATLRHWENLYMQRRAGTLSEEAWQAREPAIRQLVISAGFNDFIGSPLSDGFGGVFMNYTEQLRAE